MSRKSRERRAKHKSPKPDDYYSNGVFEVARFGKDFIMRNNCTPEQHTALMEELLKEYPDTYKHISDSLLSIKEKVVKCDPYNLLMYLRAKVLSRQINLMSEFDYSSELNSLLRAQEYVQSIMISSDLNIDHSMSTEDEYRLFSQIASEFKQVYDELQVFYNYWAAYVHKTTNISDELLNEIVEEQYMYLVRGNRYQIFELEPLCYLLPTHDEALQRLFGITSGEIIAGLEKLRYSLSKGYADALMELRNEYFSFTDAVDSGVKSSDALAYTKKRVKEAKNKVFGEGLINVKKVTGWNDKFIDLLSSGIGEYCEFWNEDEFSGWPIVNLPVLKKPFIKLNGTYYAFLYYALFDNVYRNIQKGIMLQETAYRETWKEKQTEASEKMVCDLFLRLLPGAESHIGNYYPEGKTLKKKDENDIIIVYHGNLFIIEVKAGSFPSTPPITDFEAHIKAYKTLAEVGDSQCSRTLEYIKKCESAQFYTRDSIPTFQIPNYSSFDNVFTFAVTVDNFNEFAAKAEKSSIISLKEQTIVISVDDLLVYTGYFDSPIQFLHFLKQRKSAMNVPQFKMHDELDHLGLYINQNLYASNPSKYVAVKRAFFQGFRKPIDEYFNLLYADSSHANKPTQNIPGVISDIIMYLKGNISRENISFAHFLLDLPYDAREDFSKQVEYGLKRQRELKRQIVLVSVGDIKYCVFISIPEIKLYSSQEKADYVYAVASRNESVPVMMIALEYDTNDSLVFARGTRCSFSDVKAEDRERLRKLGQEKAKDMVQQAIRTFGKIDRNGCCPCGSGKKYKYCCGND